MAEIGAEEEKEVEERIKERKLPTPSSRRDRVRHAMGSPRSLRMG